MNASEVSNRSSLRAGMTLAFAAALISGVSILVNKFAITGLKDPVLLSGMKNLVVATALVGGLLLAGRAGEVKRLSRRELGALFAIGILGGGVAFILFFRGLALASPASAALIHKTLFIWVALLAVPLLGEKLGRWQIAALLGLVAGNFLMTSASSWRFSTGDLLILAATLMWAAETIVARRVLRGGISSRLAAAARMAVGSVVIWTYLSMTGGAGAAAELNRTGWMWLIITAALLIAYVSTWYGALKLAPAGVVSSILVVGSPVTTLLSLATGQGVAAGVLAGSGAIAAAMAAFVVATMRRRARGLRAAVQ